MKQYSTETLRKIKYGLVLLCACGKTHFGKNGDKCQRCSRKECNTCHKLYVKGSDKFCNQCIKKKIRKIY